MHRGEKIPRTFKGNTNPQAGASDPRSALRHLTLRRGETCVGLTCVCTWDEIGMGKKPHTNVKAWMED